MSKAFFKKGISILLSALICLSATLGYITTPAFAANEETINALFFSHPRDGDENAFTGNWGHPDHEYMGGWSSKAGSQFNFYVKSYAEPLVSYCIEPGVNLAFGEKLKEFGDAFWKNYPDQFNDTIDPQMIRYHIGRILQYGFAEEADVENWRTQTDAAKMSEAIATQLLIWETVVGERDENFNKVNPTNGKDAIKDRIASDHPLRGQIFYYYNSIANSVKQHLMLPSFLKKSPNSATTIELEWNGSSYSATLTDTNNVLSDYTFSGGNIKYSVNGNKLTISTNTPPTSPLTIRAERKNSECRGLVVWSDGNYGPDKLTAQNLVTYNGTIKDPLSGFLKADVSEGNVKIIKTSDDGNVSGISFEIYKGTSITAANKIGTYTTDTSGVIQIPNLKAGTYTVKEIVPEGYEQQAAQTVTVKKGETATVNFNNTSKPGSLKIVKHSSDGNISGIKFEVYTGTSTSAANKIGTYTTDTSGVIQIPNLKAGTYTVKEIVPEGYEQQSPRTITVKKDETAVVEFYNSPKPGELKIIKTSDDGNVSGIKFEVYTGTSTSAANKIGTFITDENGEINIRKVPGDYTVKEIVPEGYISQQPQTVNLSYGKTAVVKFHNVKQKENSIMLTKVDEYDTSKLLSGAEFTVYKGTKPSYNNEIGIMTETSPGIYIYEGLQIGTYTVKETKAPEGYELDENTYTVSIVSMNGGKTKIITNSDNGLFTNKPKPKIETLAVSQVGGNAFASDIITITDTVSYNNLIVGKEYTVKGALMNQATGKAFTVNGNEITAEKTFTPEAANGEVVVTFTFSGREITENTRIVVFERLYATSIVLNKPFETMIASHTDINDHNQTVEIHKPSIETTATVNGEKEAMGVGSVTVTDTVKYHDLIIGEEYTVKGVLMDKSAKAPFTVNGKAVEAQTTFKAASSDGTAAVEFTFNADGIADTTELVAYERLYYKGTEIAVHADINDRNQTIIVHKPSIETTAASDGEKEVIGVGIVNITDTVKYHDLIIGKEYTVKGVLMNKATNEALIVNGKEVTAETTFIAKAADGEVIVSFTFDASGIVENTKLVAFERLYLNGIEIAAHADINDENQTVEIRKPSIGTIAASNGEKEVIGVGLVTVTDTVKYHNLIVGKEYTIKGVLMNKATNEALIIDGEEITSEVTFTAESSDGEAVVTFTFNANGIAENTSLVAFERLYKDGVEIAAHADINDEDQTVEIRKPSIETIAASNGEKETIGVGIVTVTDTVKYHDLIVGKEYTIKGVLMNKATNEALLIDGEEITSEVTFTAESSDGEVLVTFTFDTSVIVESTSLVAFERLYKDGIEIAAHADINDEEQTVTVKKPKIETTATSNGEKENFAVGTVVIDDLVKYHDLIVGKEYTVVGILMNKATNEALIIDGEEITSEVTFTAESADGEVLVAFTFDTSVIVESTSLVAFERLYKDGIEIAAHADINDEEQTVTVKKPKIETTATSNGEKENFAVGTVVIDDLVKYHDLIVGKEYTVVGILMNKATNEALIIDGEEITSEVTFTAESADGEVLVTFTFNANGITENLSIVAFETLYKDGVEIAVHADIEDEDQTVELKKPVISTVATVNGAKDAFAIGETVINDIISYRNLIAGKEYTVMGVLMNKATNEALLIDGKEVTAMHTFTADAADGEVLVTFTFDASGITENLSIVAFETLYKDGVEIAVHSDIEDEDQTVKVHKPEIDTKAEININESTNDIYVIEDTVFYKNLIPGKEYTV